MTSTCGVVWSNINNVLQQGCFEMEFARFDVDTRINTVTREEIRKLMFTCMYNQCNGMDAMSKWQTLVEDHYDLSEMHKALKYVKNSTTITTNTEGLFSSMTSTSLSIMTTGDSMTTASISIAAASVSRMTTDELLTTAKELKNQCYTWRCANVLLTLYFCAFAIILTAH
ncbi:hypothetical protein I4U23_022689 [Adineta vaga]|nr:hypothetical protein I4U23_022689 [Adineta vaga]